MNQRFGRFRRTATATVVGVSMLGAMSLVEVVGAAPAFAAPSGSLASGGSVAAASAPPIQSTGTNQPAGNLTLTIPQGSVTNNGDQITVTVEDSAGNGTIDFDHAPTVTANTGSNDPALCSGTCTVSTEDGTSNTFTITLNGGSGTVNTTESITIGASGNNTDIGYDSTAAASGPVEVTADYVGATTTAFPGSDTTAAANADVNSQTSETTYADATPDIAPGATSQAGPWSVELTGSGTQWVSGDKIYLTVAHNDTINCETAGHPDSIGFSGTPTVTATVVENGATATPTLTASLAQATNSSCAGASGVDNELVLTFSNSGTITATSADPVTINVSGVSYAVSGDTTSVGGTTGDLEGDVEVVTGYNTAPTFQSSLQTGSVPDDELVCPAGQKCTEPSSSGGQSNASVGVATLKLTANSPATTISFDDTGSNQEATAQSITDITIAEGTPGALGSGVVGWACIAFRGDGNQDTTEFDGTPTVTGSGGGLTTGNVSLLTSGSQSGPNELVFQVTTGSTGTAGTVTISGIKVNVPIGAYDTLSFGYGAENAADACDRAQDIAPGDGSGATYTTVTDSIYVPAFFEATRTYGATADDTAAAEFEEIMGSSCDTTVPAILATDQSYYDALSASYLAGQLGTGVLLTPTASLSSATLDALRSAGVTDVYVVGGPLAVSQADINQLEATPAYCDGSERTSITGTVQDLKVHQIYGQTADDTAEQVATYYPAYDVGTADYPAAYGTKTYNDTTGTAGSSASTAPDTPVATAIVVQDHGFQDAASGSVVAASEGFPVLLTPTGSLSAAASQGLVDDAIQQVIVLGGPLAVSDSVVSQIEALGISVLRIAGQDATDTSQLLATFETNAPPADTGPANGLGWTPSYLGVARGDSYTDAITAGPLLADYGPTPLLLTENTSTIGSYLPTYLKQAGQVGYDLSNPAEGTINNLAVIGGPLAITPSLFTTLTTDLDG